MNFYSGILQWHESNHVLQQQHVNSFSQSGPILLTEVFDWCCSTIWSHAALDSAGGGGRREKINDLDLNFVSLFWLSMVHSPQIMLEYNLSIKGVTQCRKKKQLRRKKREKIREGKGTSRERKSEASCPLQGILTFKVDPGTANSWKSWRKTYVYTYKWNAPLIYMFITWSLYKFWRFLF